MSVLVRTATAADGAAIGRIHTEAWQVGYEHVFGAENLATIDMEDRQRRWTARLRGEGDLFGNYDVLVAEVDGEVVGWVTCGASRDDDPDAADGELHGIYVDPRAWGKGVGPALMRATLDLLRERGFREATLWVLDDNPRARRFYEREGWRVDGATQSDTFFDIPVDEVRYRITL